MPEPFDPYLHWLGIRDPQRPPNHYRLLGVELFESDPEVISNAADRQMAHVRTFQSGRHLAESQKLLNELAAAKVCLLNPEKKAAYDAQLLAERAALAASPSGTSEPKDATQLGPAKPNFPAVFRPILLGVAISALLVVAALVTGVFMIAFGRGSSSEAVEELAQGPSDAETAEEGAASRFITPERDPSSSAKHDPSESPSGKQAGADTATKSQGPLSFREPLPKKFKPPPPRIGSKAELSGSTPSPQTEPTDSPPADKSPPVERSIAAMQNAMRQRNLAVAKRHFAAAEKAGLLYDHELVVRWSDIFSPWEEFWEAVRNGILACRDGEILRGEGLSAEVVQRADDAITVRGSAETRKQAATTYNLRTLPTWMALTLADKKLSEKTACLAKAAFFLVDPEGDPRQAAAWCELAKQRGYSPGPGLDAAVKEALAAAPPPKHVETAVSKPRLPVPDKTTQESEKARLRERYRSRLALAKNPADKGVLAGDLLREAKESENVPATRFALLALARDLSLAAGEAARFREVTEELSQRYELDLVREQTRALVEAAEEKYPAVVRSSLALLAIELALEAVQAEAFETAEQLAKAARQYANMPLGIKGRDPNAIRQATELVERIPWYQEQRKLAVQAEKTLAENPNDAKASHVLGMYDALIKEQWEQGFRLLLKSDDATLRALAEAEQAAKRSVTAAEMVKLADNWLASVPSLEAPYQRAARRRALYWYETALPFLTGDARKRVLAEMLKLRTSDTPGRQ
jgi:hypothetical protein